jgi:hypothetical protein
MGKATFYLTSILFSVVFLTTAQSAQSPSKRTRSVPSENSCAFYHDLQSSHMCPQGNYLSEIGGICEAYLNKEPLLGPEIGQFFPAVRYCLQEFLQQNESVDLCATIDDVALRSHTHCYVHHGYCNLSIASKLKLSWIMRSRIYQKRWLTAGLMIERACAQPSDFEIDP